MPRRRLTSNLYEARRHFVTEESLLAESERWHQTSLRLSGDGLPLDGIAAILGMAPEIVGRKGDHIRGDPRLAIHATNFWIYRFTTDTRVPFETQMEAAVASLEAVRDGLRGLLSLPGVKGELFLGFASGNGQGGCVFSPDLLSRVGALGLQVSLDLYPPDVVESERMPD